MATQIISDSAFGCAGQRCLAVSVAVAIGDAQKTFRDSIAESASKLRVGYGLEEGVQMGPVITPQSKTRIESLIGEGEKAGARVLVDGRNSRIPSYELGNFVKPTILDAVPANSELAHTEIFGPVLSLVHAEDMDEAMAFLEKNPFGNQASLFTSSGSAARRFRYEAPAGNIGINIGVAAPMAYFPLADGKTSFSGICTGKAAMPSSSTPTRKLSSNVGRKNSRGNSKFLQASREISGFLWRICFSAVRWAAKRKSTCRSTEDYVMTGFVKGSRRSSLKRPAAR